MMSSPISYVTIVMAVLLTLARAKPDFERNPVLEDLGALEDFGNIAKERREMVSDRIKRRMSGMTDQREENLDEWKSHLGPGQHMAYLWGTPFLRIKAHEILPRLNLNTAEFNKKLSRT